MRIKSAVELKRSGDGVGMNPVVARQIERELLKLQKEKGSGAQKTKPTKGHRCAPVELQFSPLPPVMPADRLYQALVRRFGRFYSGGEVVWELEMLPSSRHRLDMAFPYYRLGVEMDGFGSHGISLAGFKRDRQKSMLVVKEGWSILHVSNEMVNNQLPEVVDAVAQALSNRPRMEAPPMIILPSGWSRVIYT